MNIGSALIHSPHLFEFFLLLTSVAAGIFGALLGLGGGIIIVPVLTLVCGVNIRYAIGSSIVAVIATSSGAAATYVKDHMTNIRVGIFLEIATTLGALAGAALSTKLPARLLYLIFAALMIASSIFMYLRRHIEHGISPEESSPLAKRLRMASSYPDHHAGKDIAYGVSHVGLGLTLMSGAGLLSGLLGVGSGILKVPAMDTAMKLPIKVSSATSNFMIGVTAAASAGVYYIRGDVVPFLAAPVALGVFLGSWLGTRLMTRMRGSRIRWVFIGILVFTAIQMILKASGKQG